MSSKTDIAISVPAVDRDALAELAISANSTSRVFETRGLDGETFATVVIAIDASVVSVIKVWLTTRAERHKKSVVRIAGRDFRGYSPEEVLTILSRIAEGQMEEGA